jgi:hypothetical protein
LKNKSGLKNEEGRFEGGIKAAFAKEKGDKSYFLIYSVNFATSVP